MGTYLKRRFVLLLLTCVGAIGYVRSAPLFEGCSTNDDCLRSVPNSICSTVPDGCGTGQRVCLCQSGYRPDGQLTCLKEAHLDQACDQATTCVDSSSTCLSGRCDCRPGYKRNPNDPRRCLSALITAQYGQLCRDSVECEGTQECSDGRCVCLEGHVYSASAKTCIETRLGDPCSSATDCYSVFNAVCSGDASKVCACETGYLATPVNIGGRETRLCLPEYVELRDVGQPCHDDPAFEVLCKSNLVCTVCPQRPSNNVCARQSAPTTLGPTLPPTQFTTSAKAEPITEKVTFGRVMGDEGVKLKTTTPQYDDDYYEDATPSKAQPAVTTKQSVQAVDGADDGYDDYDYSEQVTSPKPPVVITTTRATTTTTDYYEYEDAETTPRLPSLPVILSTARAAAVRTTTEAYDDYEVTEAAPVLATTTKKAAVITRPTTTEAYDDYEVTAPPAPAATTKKAVVITRPTTTEAYDDYEVTVPVVIAASTTTRKVVVIATRPTTTEAYDDYEVTEAVTTKRTTAKPSILVTEATLRPVARTFTTEAYDYETDEAEDYNPTTAARPNVSLAKLGEACAPPSIICNALNSQCYASRCQCNNGYEQLGANYCNLIGSGIPLGQACKPGADVCTNTGASCVNGKCQCPAGFKGGLKNDCIETNRTGYHLDACSHSMDCYYGLSCILYKCQCAHGTKLIGNFDCVQRIFGDQCPSGYDRDCKFIKNAVCSRGICQCREGYMRKSATECVEAMWQEAEIMIDIDRQLACAFDSDCRDSMVAPRQSICLANKCQCRSNARLNQISNVCEYMGSYSDEGFACDFDRECRTPGLRCIMNKCSRRQTLMSSSSINLPSLFLTGVTLSLTRVFIKCDGK